MSRVDVHSAAAPDAGSLRRTMAAAARGVAALALTVLLLMATSPAVHALTRDDGDDPGVQLSPLEWLLYFVGGPILLFVVIAVLVFAPSMARGPRYRPGLGWWHAPVWFDGPARATPADAAAEPTLSGGGASARW